MPLPSLTLLRGYELYSSVTVENWTAGSIGCGSKTVATSGVAEALGNEACYRVHVRANTDNSGIIVFGDNTVTASPVNGAYLEAGESITLNIENINLVYIDASVSGEGVSFTYEAA